MEPVCDREGKGQSSSYRRLNLWHLRNGKYNSFGLLLCKKAESIRGAVSPVSPFPSPLHGCSSGLKFQLSMIISTPFPYSTAPDVCLHARSTSTLTL